MKPEDRIGTTVNGWKILDMRRCYLRSGTRVQYIIQCSVCKKQRIATISDIRRTPPIKDNKCCHYRKWKIKQLKYIWHSMKSRCYNKNNQRYTHYGQRGINICEEWLSDNGLTFQDWALENGYRDGLTIDRIDVNGNYEPGNCRWITRSDNNRGDKTNSVYYVVGMYKYNATQWSLICRMNKRWLEHLKLRHGYNYAHKTLLKRLWEINWFQKNKPLTDEEINEKYKEFLRDEGEPYEEDIKEENEDTI